MIQKAIGVIRRKYPTILLKTVSPLVSGLFYIIILSLLLIAFSTISKVFMGIFFLYGIGVLLTLSSMFSFYHSIESKRRWGDIIAGALKGWRFIYSFTKYKRAMRAIAVLLIVDSIVLPAVTLFQGNQLPITEQFILTIPYFPLLDLLTLVEQATLLLLIGGIFCYHLITKEHQLVKWQMTQLVITEAKRLQLDLPISHIPGGPFLRVSLLGGSLHERVNNEMDTQRKIEMTNFLVFIRDNAVILSQTSLHPEPKHPSLFEYWLAQAGKSDLHTVHCE
ncbi:hypothetical protein ACFYU8_18735 [Brevibacillus sp. NPDC003359]|uniref:hypothetical protein n=1 Tax=unclassified Brevibacillus TaxID=2684853 RepID=UPI0036C2CE82